ENVFGMLGIIFWSFQLLPQVIDNYRAKSTEGLSYSMFFIWTLGALGFGSYGVVENLSIPIIVQPQIFGSLSALCYLQCLYYGKRTQWSLRRTVVGGIVIFVAMAGIQVAAVYATKAGEDHHVKGTTAAAGVIPIILIAIGFMPQYFDIYKDRSVVGVSMAFIAADAMGAVFSIISLCFRETIDLLATLNYVVVLICDTIIAGFYIYYNRLNPSLARVRDIKEEKETGTGEIGGE
ncbi:PQ loop repeat-domain-containing protein, partial [Dissophora ornata]